ncbi:tetraspanin-9 [Microplitis mediator]|uniref:tetraspanin-9 n=1 Tax=Microplitis mediator TaxID=375433 RepID=UPI0025579FA1|nr:tetraspanin-9 [Microplitis mediator]
MESCGMNTVKYLLIFFNCIFAISGFGILVTGCIVLADVTNYSHFMQGRILAPPILLIIVGMIVFITSFLGCYGALKEKHFLLIVFSVALLTIFTVQLAIGIAVAVFRSDVSDVLRTGLREALQKYKAEEDGNAWNSIQKHFHCCGVDSADDWNEPMGGPELPQSCCQDTSTTPCFVNENPTVYENGCYDILETKIRENSKVLMGVGIGIAIIEIIGVILGFSLATTIKRESTS